MELKEERLEIVKLGKEMLAMGLTSGTWGNISLKVSPDSILITPSGLDYQKTVVSDIVHVDFAGQLIDARRKPSSELALHLAIYKNRKDIKAIVHTHSTYASAFAVVRKSIPAFIEDQVQIVGGEIEVANYAPAGSNELGVNALEALKGKFGALLASHGVLGLGRNLKEALTVCQIIEKSAKMAALAMSIGQPYVFTENEIQKMREFYLKNYAPIME